MAALRKFGIILIFANLALARIAFSQWPQPGKCVRVSNDGSTLETSSYDCGAGGGGGIASLNALIDPAQTFATGTSGDDFNISSVSPIHAFNFPSASATKRGLLSFTDWGIFNGKESVLTFNSPLSRSVNTITCPTCSVSGHAHAEADVTNLVADLAAKVPTSRRIDTTTPLQGGDNLTADRTFSILQAGSAQSGYLSSTDWSLFNAKESSLTFSSPLSRSVNTITCPTCSISGHAHVEGDVTNLVTDLAAKEATANKNVASGYAGLDVNVRVPTARLGSGTPSASTFLRGDQTWAVPGSGSESENIVRTTSDVTNSTTTFADVTGQIGRAHV